MLKIPLPSSSAVWQASTATEWETAMTMTRQPSRGRSMQSLQAALEMILPMRTDHPQYGKRDSLRDFFSNPFAIQIFIHGIASTVFEHRFRTVESACRNSVDVLKLGEFEEALSRWHTCFLSMGDVDRETEMARSALITYHLVSILLRESLSDIQMAAGTSYSWGRAVTPQRAQEAFLPLITTKPVGRDGYFHALEIVSLCLNERMEISSPGSMQSENQSRLSATPQPLYLTYNAFIGVLVLWAYGLGLGRSKTSQQQPADSFGRHGKKSSITLVRQGSSLNGQASSNNSTSILANIIERESNRPDMDPNEVERIRSDVRLLMQMVRDRLINTSWEICMESASYMSREP
jgi:hypothetical protein